MSGVKHLEDNLNQCNAHQPEEKTGVDGNKKEESKWHESEIMCKMDKKVTEFKIL